MKTFLKKLPIPAGCVALGLIGLGTLLSGQSIMFLWLFGGLSILLQGAVLLKLCMPGVWKSVCENPTALSTLAGTSMAMMLTAAQLKKLSGLPAAAILWLGGILLHLLIVLLFSRLLLLSRPGPKGVRGSWLLVYVGIAASAISGPAFSASRAGLILLIPAALGALVLLPLIFHADRSPGNVPESQKPLFCITAAPVSIWLAGYLSACPQPSVLLTAILMIAGQLLYFPALVRCLRCVKRTFTPAFAAFTFPFVISASALKQSITLLGLSTPFRLLQYAETIIALLLCLYTLALYLRSLFNPKASAG